MGLIHVDIVRQEIAALHHFFIDWFSGAIENTDAAFAEGLVNRFAPSCILIQPNGSRSQSAEFCATVRNGYGSNPEFRIAIRNVSLVWHSSDHVLATYEEWQRNAKSSTPPDNGRVATVLFRWEPTASALRWLHIHETWLPIAVMRRGPYDF